MLYLSRNVWRGVEGPRWTNTTHAVSGCSLETVRTCLRGCGNSVIMLPAMRSLDEYEYCVYIMSSVTGTLYIGITGDFYKRILQPKAGEIEGFSSTYKCVRLVYYEAFDDVRRAIAREKQLKRWRREKKIALIEKMNPRWQDLAENWGREILLPGQRIVKTP
jgi:putative endonuclease